MKKPSRSFLFPEFPHTISMAHTYLIPLVSKDEVAQDTFAYTFSIENTDYSFQPGQYAYFTLIDPPFPDDENNTRLFSFVNAPNGKTLTILLRMRQSPYKRSLDALNVGEKVQVCQPLGFFELHQDESKPAVFIAGGVGIAPIMSLLSAWTQNPTQHTISVFVSNKNVETQVYYSELLDLKDIHDFNLFFTLTQSAPWIWQHDTGRWDAHRIFERLPNPLNTIYYLSGTPAMVESLSEQLQEQGIPLAHIKQEAFTGY